MRSYWVGDLTDRVEIDGIENAAPGTYTVELTLEGDAPDKTFDLRYVVTDPT